MSPTFSNTRIRTLCVIVYSSFLRAPFYFAFVVNFIPYTSFRMNETKKIKITSFLVIDVRFAR